MEKKRVLVLGAGAAGLATAQRLSSAGVAVTLLEARDRLGGRLFTVVSGRGKLPIELGAEFIHGENIQTWEYIRLAKLRTREVPARHCRIVAGTMKKDRQFWDQIQQALSRINLNTPDQDLQSFLDEAWSLSPEVKQMVCGYVEGFHAAAAERASIHALAQAEAAAQRDNATRQFRMVTGYSSLLRWFTESLANRDFRLHLNTVVTSVRWEAGRVEVLARTPAGAQRFEAEAAVITLPLGVLQDPASVSFEPGLPGKEAALAGLQMGSVVKLTLQFQSIFWPVADFGFLHAEEGLLPTWWSNGRAPLLTGWAGGPRAERLQLLSKEELVAGALEQLTNLFKVDPVRLRDWLVASYTHDWTADPFSRGAYSYIPVRMLEMPRRLAAPVAETLFFAGEATDTPGEQGTVQAALASGRRAASEVLGSPSRLVLSPARLAAKG